MPVKVEMIINKTFYQRLYGALEKGVREACLVAENEAALRCPVDTGRLRGSIMTKVETNDKGAEGIIGTSGVEYAPFVEFGTVRQPAQPFLRPACIENEAVMGYVLQRNLAKVIK